MTEVQHYQGNPNLKRAGQQIEWDEQTVKEFVKCSRDPAYFAGYGGAAPARTGATHPAIAPYGPYTAGDGRVVYLGIQNEREWVAFCEKVLLQPELATDARFSGNAKRSQAREALRRHAGNVAAAAEALAIPKKTLYDKLKRFDLNSEDFR